VHFILVKQLKTEKLVANSSAVLQVGKCRSQADHFCGKNFVKKTQKISDNNYSKRVRHMKKHSDK